MIKVNKIAPQTVEHFDPEGNSLGFLNEDESTDLRAQIAEEKTSGYSLIFEGERFEINKNGVIINWPNGVFDLLLKDIERIMRARFKK